MVGTKIAEEIQFSNVEINFVNDDKWESFIETTIDDKLEVD